MSTGRGLVRAGCACGALLASTVLLATSASAETITFTHQGCEVWTAPASVAIHVEAVGSAGESGGAPGGNGDGVHGTIARRAGESLDICVNEGFGVKSSQFGGGWSGVILGTELNHARVAVLAAGGGAGGSFANENGSGGAPGAGGDAGRRGGGTARCVGGGPGTALEGGARGKCDTSSFDGTEGTEFHGGGGGFASTAIENGDSLGGGGGGGYYGGGGGAGYEKGGQLPSGGGGGSDFCGNGTVECSVHAGIGTLFFALGPEEFESHVTLTTTPLGNPTVTKVTPASGPATGDKLVTIVGTNFKVVQVVSFGGVPALRYSVNEAGTEIGAVSPAREVAGPVDVTVTTGIGTSAINNKDHYKYLPVITKVEPNTGSHLGDEEIEVFGAGFKTGLNVNTVLFGTTPAESFCEPTNCQVLTPAHAAGTVDVRITVNGLTSAKTKADQYTYK